MTDRLSRRAFVKLASASAAAVAAGDGLLRPQVAGAHDLFNVARSLPTQMPMLDPQMQAVIDELMALEAPKITDMTPFNARLTSALTLAVQAVLTKQGKPPLEPVFNIAHRLIPGGTGQQLLIR